MGLIVGVGEPRFVTLVGRFAGCRAWTCGLPANWCDKSGFTPAQAAFGDWTICPPRRPPVPLGDQRPFFILLIRLRILAWFSGLAIC